MFRRYIVPLSWMLVCSVWIFSCKKEKDDPKLQNESEIITTFHYYLNPVGGGTSAVFTFRDLDGEGGKPPEIITDSLASNKVYQGQVILLNEQKNPPDTISKEVLTEGTKHQLFYQPSVAGLSVQYQDTDADRNPIGLITKLTTGSAANGILRVTLRHEPNKSAAGVVAGDITNAGGETDIEVSFNVTVR
ncbi:MAG: type 1 periplasmic binding fold superfamily protein [Bacteroidia bacterium]|nr:type 1 periplasmic binding fold superfamily protein [Bacteroidia bacterium]